MSVFSTDELGCGIFSGSGPCGGGGTYMVSHARAAHLLYGIPPAQDARGEIRLSFVAIGEIPLDMQPMDRSILREIHGIVQECAWHGITGVGANLRELDRAYFMGQHLEIVQVSPWVDHLEVLYKEIGR